MKEYEDMLREERVLMEVNKMNPEQIEAVLESNPYHREGFLPPCDCPECWPKENI